MSTATNPTGVVLMTYGSASTSRDVTAFLRHVYPKVSADTITEFKRRFDIVGSSPLIKLTQAQAQALQSQLGHGYRVAAGMLHSKPFIEQAVERLKTDGCQSILGLLLSPQYSPIIMSNYNQALREAGLKFGFENNQIRMAGPWADQPQFIELLSRRLTAKRQELAAKSDLTMPVIFTTHSLPERVVKQDPDYLRQLQQTITAVVQRCGLEPGTWWSAYQSAGHTPEAWLKPDLVDILKQLVDCPAVIIVPIQFLADHLEVLYDLDTAARAQCEELDIGYHRIELPNTDRLFIKALAEVVKQSV